MARDVALSEARPRLLAVGSHDSFFAAASAVARSLAPHGFDVAAYALRSRQDAALEAASGRERPETIPLSALGQGLLAQADVLLLSCDGDTFRKVVAAVEALGSATAPAVVGLWPGIVTRDLYENFAARLGADLLLFADCRTKTIFDAFARELGGAAPRSFLFGHAQTLMAELAASRAAPPKVMTFFEQAILPESLEERRFLAVSLLGLCARYPHWRLQFKPRMARFGPAVNRAIYDLLDLARREAGGRLPENFTVVTAAVPELLAGSAVTLTVSSSAALESLIAGVPAVVISDFGISDRIGNSYFIGSGCLRTFSEFDPERPPRASEAWKRRFLVDARARVPALGAVLETLRHRAPAGAPRLEACSPAFAQFLERRWSRADIEQGLYRRRRRHMILNVLAYKLPTLFSAISPYVR